MLPTPLVPEWVVLVSVAVPNFAAGLLILIFRKRIRLLVKSVVPRMSETAEFWASRVILVGGLFLMAVPTLAVFGAITSGA